MLLPLFIRIIATFVLCRVQSPVKIGMSMSDTFSLQQNKRFIPKLHNGLFHELHRQNLSGFMQRLNKVRAEQMGPLSTASFEQGSYQRGYESIVRYEVFLAALETSSASVLC